MKKVINGDVRSVYGKGNGEIIRISDLKKPVVNIGRM